MVIGCSPVVEQAIYSVIEGNIDARQVATMRVTFIISRSELVDDQGLLRTLFGEVQSVGNWVTLHDNRHVDSCTSSCMAEERNGKCNS